ncbi:MAG: DUF2262 domain-containing protein [Oscillospiraceae bacterium]|nr:DUF2262 domain-containing protein [Oscillospiraceae bacterium]
MEYQDFREDDVFSMKGTTCIWSEREVEIGLDLNDERGKREQVLRYLDAINAQLDWIIANRAVIADMLVKSGMLTLAEDWISGAEELDAENAEIYRLEDGTEVALPLPEKTFRDSLRMEGITIDLTGGRENMSTPLFLFCDPDYFAGHSILLNIEADGTMECLGLAG